MASVSRESGGRKRIQVICPDGKRRSIRLGKLSIKDAQLFCSHVERLMAAKIAGRAPEDQTSLWLTGLPAKIVKRLRDCGLTDERPNLLVTELVDQYISEHSHRDELTLIAWGNVRRNLAEHFGKREVRTLTEGDAAGFSNAMERDGQAIATRRKRMAVIKQMFNWGVRQGYLAENPFQEMKSGNYVNRERQQFIDRETIRKVMNACTDDEFRLILALARYGGLRCPSEIVALTWEDIDRENGRFTVRKNKTEERCVPLFPELMFYLDQIESGSGPVIRSYQDRSGNMRTRMMKAIKRAGLEPWPKVFQNLRASRETELLEEYPLHVVVEWIGNSQPVALKHYAIVRDEHFQRASKVAHKSTRTIWTNAAKMVNNCPLCGSKDPRIPETKGKEEMSQKGKIAVEGLGEGDDT